jgi:hypothetical protein
VKVELYPEDILLEFAASALQNGSERAVVRQAPYLKHLPRSIELSEDFALQWQTMIKAAVKRFVADTFGLRPFLFDVDGYTRRFNSADEHFWNSCSFSFSHRGAERIYELMMREFIEEEPMFLVALPDDALMISICTQNFGRYSFPWLCRNKACWLTQALFVACQNVPIHNVSWLYLFEKPSEVALPLRELLIERCSDVLITCNARVRWLINGQGEWLIPAREGRMPARVMFHSLGPNQFFSEVRTFISSADAAFNEWSGTAVVGIDDERFIKGAMQQYGFKEEVREFERLVGEFSERSNVEDMIYESIIQNQHSGRSSTD